MTNTAAPYEDLRKHYIDRDHPIHGEDPVLPDKDGEYTVYVPFVGPDRYRFYANTFHWHNGDVMPYSLWQWWK